MKKKIFTKKNILTGVLGVTTGILLLKNNRLNKKINELTGENENNKDLIKGLQRAIERLCFNLGKASSNINNK